jgi:hypothetical protein
MVVPLPIVSLALSFLFYLSPDLRIERNPLITWEASVAERMESPPNPYQDFGSELPASRRDFEGPGIAPPSESGGRRWFDMEDSGDMMGLKLNSRMRAGLQVEFAGYAEDDRQSRRMINMKYDPYHPAYLLTTAGLQFRF